MASMPRSGGAWLGDHGQTGDLAQDAERICLECPLDIHHFPLIHNACEDRRFSELDEVGLNQG
jgi:hypothetical protein